ncbi:unnamed protein product [Cuscuta epithymum]|uniref:chorismate mutase n=1 Tax=Cuscuta epithymum TaxID=186058 RepID=A0AAV0CC86_9ASTE|nr:unnamed protein product [Cuscuta epithymum]
MKSQSQKTIAAMALFFVGLCLAGKMMPAAADCSSGDNNGKVMTLDSVRESLVRQEDTIILSLMERAKHPMNAQLYDNKSTLFKLDGSGSLFEYFVKQSEILQSKMGRYLSLDELPFFPDGLSQQASLVPDRKCIPFLHPAGKSINNNGDILEKYVSEVLPLFVMPGEDENYTTTATSDLQVLQALSRRIHDGKFVAEAKYTDAPQDYNDYITRRNKDELMRLITDTNVERGVINRVGLKAAELRKCTNNTIAPKLNASAIYENFVIPLTKDVEVDYLLQRLNTTKN